MMATERGVASNKGPGGERMGIPLSIRVKVTEESEQDLSVTNARRRESNTTQDKADAI